MKSEEFVHGMVTGRVMALDVGKVRVGVALSFCNEIVSSTIHALMPFGKRTTLIARKRVEWQCRMHCSRIGKQGTASGARRASL